MEIKGICISLDYICFINESDNEDSLWVPRMMRHKNPDIILRVYAKAFKLQRDKNKRKKKAAFLVNLQVTLYYKKCM